MKPVNLPENDVEEKVPLLGSWGGWYLFVLVFLGVLILFFYWLTKLFA